MPRSRWTIAGILALSAVFGCAAFGVAGLASAWLGESRAQQAETALGRVHASLSGRLDMVPIVTAPGAGDEGQDGAREFCEAYRREAGAFAEASEQLPLARHRLVRAVELLSGGCRAYASQPADAAPADRRQAGLDLRVAARRGLQELQTGLAEWRRFDEDSPASAGLFRLAELLALLGLSGCGLFLLAKREWERNSTPQASRPAAATDGPAAGQWMRTAMEAASEGILIVEADGRIRSANAAAERILGFARSQLVGLEAAQVVPGVLASPESCGVLERVAVKNLEGAEAECHVSWFRRRGVADAPTIVFLQSAPPLAAPEPASSCAAQGPVELDAEAFARLENEILQVTGFGEIALAQLPSESEARIDLERLTRAAARAALLCRQAAPVAPRMAGAPLGLNAFIGEFEQRLLALLEPGTDLMVRTDGTAGSVAADSGLLEQSLLSLVLQGLESVPEPRLIRLTTSPGRIEVTLGLRGAPNPGWRRVLGDLHATKVVRWLAAQGATLEQDVADNRSGLRFRIHLMPHADSTQDDGSSAAEVA